MGLKKEQKIIAVSFVAGGLLMCLAILSIVIMHYYMPTPVIARVLPLDTDYFINTSNVTIAKRLFNSPSDDSKEKLEKFLFKIDFETIAYARFKEHDYYLIKPRHIKDAIRKIANLMPMMVRDGVLIVSDNFANLSDLASGKRLGKSFMYRRMRSQQSKKYQVEVYLKLDDVLTRESSFVSLADFGSVRMVSRDLKKIFVFWSHARNNITNTNKHSYLANRNAEVAIDGVVDGSNMIDSLKKLTKKDEWLAEYLKMTLTRFADNVDSKILMMLTKIKGDISYRKFADGFVLKLQINDQDYFTNYFKDFLTKYARYLSRQTTIVKKKVLGDGSVATWRVVDDSKRRFVKELKNNNQIIYILDSTDPSMRKISFAISKDQLMVASDVQLLSLESLESEEPFSWKFDIKDPASKIMFLPDLKNMFQKVDSLELTVDELIDETVGVMTLK